MYILIFIICIWFEHQKCPDLMHLSVILSITHIFDAFKSNSKFYAHTNVDLYLDVILQLYY